MDRYQITLTFTTEMLGTAPPAEVFKRWIADQRPDVDEEALQEEGETLPETNQVGTAFHRNDQGQPLIYDYMLKGFFKEACGALRRVQGTQSAKLTAYRKVIDGLLFVEPRQIVLDTKGQAMGSLERPLRASGPMGDRIALAISESAPTGTTLEFRVMVLGVITPELLTEWLDYGRLSGLGQWRSGGYGRFTHELASALA